MAPLSVRRRPKRIATVPTAPAKRGSQTQIKYKGPPRKQARDPLLRPGPLSWSRDMATQTLKSPRKRSKKTQTNLPSGPAIATQTNLPSGPAMAAQTEIPVRPSMATQTDIPVRLVRPSAPPAPIDTRSAGVQTRRPATVSAAVQTLQERKVSQLSQTEIPVSVGAPPLPPSIQSAITQQSSMNPTKGLNLNISTIVNMPDKKKRPPPVRRARVFKRKAFKPGKAASEGKKKKGSTVVITTKPRKRLN